MDLWDVVRLMLRRWAIAVPLLILTVAGTVWVGMNVKPDYTAEGNISLLPPSVEEVTAAGKSRNVNPWDTDSLTAAIAVRLRSKALHDDLDAQGYSGVFEADRDVQFPSVITIKVTAPTEQQATATVKQLLEIVTREVDAQQAQYKLESGEKITTTVIDDGSNVEAATGKVKRALIVVFGIGAVITMAVTVCVDAFLRARARRRIAANERLAAQALKLPSLAQSANAQSTTVRSTNVQSVQPANLQSNGSAEETRPIVVSQPKPKPTPTATPAKVDVEPADSSPEATQRIPGRIEPITEDATIVLPLSNAPWVGKKAKNAESGSEVTKR